MKKVVKKILSLPYSTYVVPDLTTDNQKCYVAYHPELEGCMSHGSTVQEAIQNLQEVTDLYLATMADEGVDLPAPREIKVVWYFDDPETRPEIESVQLPAVGITSTPLATTC